MTFNLKTNQSSHSDINGVTITITHDNITKTLTWYGSELTYTIPAGLLYTVSYSAVTGYTTPASLTFTAVGGNTNSISATYNIKTYTLTVKVSGLSSGFSIIVEYDSITKTQTVTNATYTVTHGSIFYVRPNDITNYSWSSGGYNTSGIITSNRTIPITYSLLGTINPTNGVYIKATNGRFYTRSEFDDTDCVPDCIAVITSSCRFGIALTTEDINIGMSNTKYENRFTAYSESDAKKDYDGVNNTNIMVQLNSNSRYAAGYCNNYVFPSGNTGYLPALGELIIANSYHDEIINCLYTAGAIAGFSGHIASSTYAGKITNEEDGYEYNSFWLLYGGRAHLDTGYTYEFVQRGYIYSELTVRPFCIV